MKPKRVWQASRGPTIRGEMLITPTLCILSFFFNDQAAGMTLKRFEAEELGRKLSWWARAKKAADEIEQTQISGTSARPKPRRSVRGRRR